MIFDDNVQVVDDIYFSRPTWEGMTDDQKLAALREAIRIQRLLERNENEEGMF